MQIQPQTRTIPFGMPIIGEEERAAVADVLGGTTLTHGPRVKEFEADFRDFTGAEHAVATATCMAALHLAYLAIDLGPEEEVIVPAQTHVATAHAVELCGARPVFADAERRTGNLDLDALEALVTPQTRAISLVHYIGRPVQMRQVMDVARRHDLYVVEDCAVALGARVDDVHVGLHGDVGCFSFYPVKHITTGEGGMLITRRPEIAEKVAKQRAFGIDKSVLLERRHSSAYEVEHVGLNYRLGELNAALGIEQMKRLPGFLEHRARIFGVLEASLRDVDGLTILESGGDHPLQSSHYCLVAILEPPLASRRNELIERLKRVGIGTSVYYPRALPDTAFYRERYGYAQGSCPVAARISASSIALPVGPHVTAGDAEHIAGVVQQLIGEMHLDA